MKVKALILVLMLSGCANMPSPEHSLSPQAMSKKIYVDKVMHLILKAALIMAEPYYIDMQKREGQEVIYNLSGKPIMFKI